MSESATAVRVGYVRTIAIATSRKPWRRPRSIRIVPRGGANGAPGCERATSTSMASTVARAPASSPCVSDQRGLSGIVRRKNTIASARTAPIANAIRQP